MWKVWKGENHVKIKLILTGGTIGSKVEEENSLADVTRDSVYLLVKAYEEKYGKDTDFDIELVLQSLSENFSPDTWEKLCKSLNDIDTAKYDGIVLAHGTDTLSYTSSLLSILFAENEIPIVCIASNYPIGMKKSNGLDNFRSAVIFIKETRNLNMRGVYTIFQNRKKENVLYAANQLMESDAQLDEFSSFGNEILGKIEIVPSEKVELYQEKVHNYAEFQKKCVQVQRTKEISKDIQFKHKIQIIYSYPGMDYSLFEIAYCRQKEGKKPKAVLLVLYHSATACVEGAEYSALSIIRTCREQGIDFYMTSFKRDAETTYVTTQKLLDAGAIPLYEMSVELSYVKLCCAYNQNRIEPKAFMDA